MSADINKIIFFVETPFNLRDYRRFGIDLLRENGMHVEIWDFSPIVNKRVFQKVQVNDPISYQHYVLFKSMREAVAAILHLRQCVFIIFLLGYGVSTYRIYRAVSSKRNLIYSLLLGNKLPNLSNKIDHRHIHNLYKKLINITPYKILDYIFSNIKFKSLGIKPAGFVLNAGGNAIPQGQPIDRTTQYLSFHALDYDLYLEERSKKFQNKNDKSAVFLDEYLPFHPDFIRLGIDSYSTAEEYYPLLCNFFDYLEDNHGFQITIAAHPRSRYENHPDYFGGRRVLRGETIRLVRESFLIITHCSTSVNFAVLFEKPIIFVTTNKLNKTYEGAYIDAMAEALGKKAINLETSIALDIHNELSIDSDAYKRYKNMYIKSERTEDTPFWQLFVNRLRNISSFYGA